MNPSRFAAVPRTREPEIDPFTTDEVRRVLAASAKVRNRARWSVALALGLRKGEAMGLAWADVDLEEAAGLVFEEPVDLTDALKLAGKILVGA